MKTVKAPTPLCLLFVTALSAALISSATSLKQLELHPSYIDRFVLLNQQFRAALSRGNFEQLGPRDFALEDSSLRDAFTLGASPTAIRDAVLQSLVDISKTSAEKVLEGLEESQNTSSELCANHTKAFVQGIREGETWAIQMLDATGKPRPAISEGNLNWPGAYRQCVGVRANTSVTSQPEFSGQYCTATAVLPSVAGASANVPSGLVVAGLILGICMPNTCSENDILLLIEQVLSNLNTTAIQPASVTCAYKDTVLDTRAIIALVIIGVFFALVVLGTLLDILHIQMPKWRVPSKLYVTANGHDIVKSENQPLLPKKEDVVPEIGFCVKLLVSFSVYTNVTKLLSTSQPAGSLTCVHGIRFLSMTWVVLGHCYSTPLSLGENVVPALAESLKRWTFQAIANATLSVDSFFLLSGLLVAYLSLKEMKKKSGKMNWFLFYFHRFWRLTPAYMMCIMIYVCLMRYWGEGPFWPKRLIDRDSCEKNWWTNLLYINNVVKLKDTCFGHAWYLANDMQFYVLSPLIFVPFYFSPVAGSVVSVLFLVATALTPALLTIRDGYPPNVLAQVQTNNSNLENYMSDFYVKPYNRMGPYVVGMLAGYFLYCRDCKLQLGKVTNLCLWALATGTAMAVVYGLYDACNGHPVTLPVSAFYNAVNRQVWAASVAWVVIACVTGNGGFVNTVLSWKGFVPLSRLTYCIYLIHIMILETYVYNMKTLFYVTDINLVALFLAMLALSTMAAFLVSLVFEAPMMMLEKIILQRNTQPRAEQKQ